MSVQKNKAAVNRLHDVIQKRNWSALSELFSPNYILHTTPEVKGPEGVKQMFTTMINAFPDYQEIGRAHV